MEIRKISDQYINKTSELLRSYWKERNLDYSLRWAKEYIIDGHKKEIKDDIFFVAKENEDVLGCISVIIYEGNLAELRDFVVGKNSRRKGIGRQLFEYAYNWCLQNNIRKIYCLSFPYLRGFWIRNGFMLEGELKSHFKDGEDLIIFSKLLKKEDKQADLKKEIQEIENIQSVETGTSQMLKKLPTRKK